MTRIDPIRLQGPWSSGFVLDLHTAHSIFIGHDEFGHEVFDTTRTEVGELLYRLKYQGDTAALPQLGDVAEVFIRRWGPAFDLIVPVPPTRARRVQPVFQLAAELSRRFAVGASRTAVRKLKNAAELKDVHDFDARQKLLDGAITADERQVKGRRVLLVDDLVRSGATMRAVAEALKRAGAEAVCAFAFTKTRRG